MEWESYICDFLSYLGAEKGLSINTIRAYGRDIRSFCKGAKKGVDEEGVIRYLEERKEKGDASSSIYRSLISLRLFFRFLKREGLIDRDPTRLLESPKMWQLIPEVLTIKEVEALIKAPDPSHEEGMRDRAILETFYATGIRVSELCALDIYDVGEKSVRVIGKGGRERIVPIGEEAIAAIDRYLGSYRDDKGEKGALFVSKRGKRLNRTYLWERVKCYAKKVGIEKEVSPHTLRHSFATDLINKGARIVDVSELLGHKELSTTQVYTKLGMSKKLSGYLNAHPMCKE